jgi:hypothetical protein
MINWRSIKEVGYPTDSNLKYLVTDGKDISTSDASINKNYNTGETKFNKWIGDDNTWEYNDCCSGERVFEMKPTHWCPINEINLPIIINQ